MRCNENEHAKSYPRFRKSQEVSVLLHIPNQRYKQLKIENGQNDRSSNSSVEPKVRKGVKHLSTTIAFKKHILKKKFSSRERANHIHTKFGKTVTFEALIY